MSIIKRRFSSQMVFAAVLLASVVAAVPAQKIEANIKINLPASVGVEGRLIKQESNQSFLNWSFTDTIAAAENLAVRVSQFSLADEKRQPVAFVKLCAGEYLADAEAAAFQYRVDLNSPKETNAMAHQSWLDGERGLLMLGDLLPQLAANNPTARVKFDLPTGWKIISSEKKTGENSFEIENLEKAVFLVGKNWRTRQTAVGKTNLSLAIDGEWQFSDAEAVETARKIHEEYRKLFGAASFEKSQIFLIRLPKETRFGRWAAETRGATISILSADMPFKAQSAQRLHEQLRHEIFHLWMPNRLALTGNYDWFYEGFTVYQALRTGVAMNRIRFEDYLDTLAQAFDLDRRQNNRVSLIDQSKNLRSGANRQVYARGMLAAFLCDAALLGASRGRRSIEEIFRAVYRKHQTLNEPENGNQAITKILKNYAELDSIVGKYIIGAERINWETNLESLGIEATEENSFTKLNVKTKLSGKQKDLLNKLGYNNWRKTSEIIK